MLFDWENVKLLPLKSLLFIVNPVGANILNSTKDIFSPGACVLVIVFAVKVLGFKFKSNVAVVFETAPSWETYELAPLATDFPIPCVEKFFWSNKEDVFASCVKFAKYLFSLTIKDVSTPDTWSVFIVFATHL